MLNSKLELKLLFPMRRYKGTVCLKGYEVKGYNRCVSRAAAPLTLTSVAANTTHNTGFSTLSSSKNVTLNYRNFNLWGNRQKSSTRTSCCSV